MKEKQGKVEKEEVAEFTAGEQHPDMPEALRKDESENDAEAVIEIEKQEVPILTKADLERSHSRTAWEEIFADGKHYKVEVLRGQPIHNAVLLQTSPEVYAIRDQKNVKFVDMPDDERKAASAEQTDFQQLVVASFLLTPRFSYKGDIYLTTDEFPLAPDQDILPIESVSYSMLTALFRARERVNVPKEEQTLIDRFPKMGGKNETRQDSDD